MPVKITKTLIAVVVVTSATLAASHAGPLAAPTAAEKAWMDRASGPADGN